MNKKIGIIGGGIGGLVCAYRLIEKGFSPVVFEKKASIGGRVPYCGAVATESFHPRLTSLIKELELEELKVPLFKKEQAFFAPDDSVITMDKLPLISLKTFSMGDMIAFIRLNAFVNGLEFNIEKFDPKLKELRDISFEEYLKVCPDTVRKMVVEPMMIFTYEEDLSKISAEFGISHMRFANELGTGKAFGFEENNIMAVTNVLEKIILEKGGEIVKSANVENVRKENDEFVVSYYKEGEKEDRVENVVFATPLNITEKIFPELNIESDIDYPESKCLFVEGELKRPEIKFMIGMPGNKANLKAVFNVFPYYQLVYPADMNKEVDLSKLYNKHKVVEEESLSPAMPVIGPGDRVPEMETDTEGAYLCGDYYYYPWLETAVVTAEIVAKKITEKNS